VGSLRRLLVMIILGAAVYAAWLRYGMRGVYIRVVNKTGQPMHDVRLANATQTAHRGLLDPSEEWDERLAPGDVDSDVRLTFTDYGGESCSAMLGVQARKDRRVGYAALVYTCTSVEVAEELRE
jgi:hypothetical protein